MFDDVIRTEGIEMKSYSNLGLLIVGIVISQLLSSVSYSKDYNIVGQRGYALWNCASLGILTKDAELASSTEDLFNQGYELLQDLLTGLLSGKIKDEDIKQIPVGLKMYMTGGPTADFRLGYMWAQFLDHSYGSTWPDLDDIAFAAKEDLQKMTAKSKFIEANCHLL